MVQCCMNINSSLGHHFIFAVREAGCVKRISFDVQWYYQSKGYQSKGYTLMYNGITNTNRNLKPFITLHGLQALSNSLFVGLSKAQRVQSEREQSAHQIWSSDFKSQMSNALDSLDSVDIINV